jgi:hypothetical protein
MPSLSPRNDYGYTEGRGGESRKCEPSELLDARLGAKSSLPQTWPERGRWRLPLVLVTLVAGSTNTTP